MISFAVWWGDDSNQRQRHPSGERSRWEKKCHFVKLHSKMIWLVIFHWFKWLRWEVQYYFYTCVRESLRSIMPCQPSLAKHSWAWYTWQMPENALGVVGFFQRLLPPPTSQRAEKSALLRAWEKEAGAQGIWIWMSRLLSSSAPTGWKVLRIQGAETQVLNKCRWMWYSFNISCMRAKPLWSCLTLWESSWTRARQAPLSMGISRQEYWRGLRALLRGNLAHPGIKPTSPVSPALASEFSTTEPPGKPNFYCLSMWIISNLLSLLVPDLCAQHFWNSLLNLALNMLHQGSRSMESWVITGPVKWCLGQWDHPLTPSSTSFSFTSASEMIVSRKKTLALTSQVRNRFMYVHIYLCKEHFTLHTSEGRKHAASF